MSLRSDIDVLTEAVHRMSLQQRSDVLFYFAGWLSAACDVKPASVRVAVAAMQAAVAGAVLAPAKAGNVGTAKDAKGREGGEA